MPRGSDFEARCREGAWAEDRVREVLSNEQGLRPVHFGITDDTAFWSPAEMARHPVPPQDTYGKRPDILVFDIAASVAYQDVVSAGDLCDMTDQEADTVVPHALLAIEVEFSPYNYRHRLLEYHKELSFTLKDEDLQPLKVWSAHFGVPVALVQVYVDSAFYISLRAVVAGIDDGTIRRQRERAYNKDVYYPPMSRGLVFADFVTPAEVVADVILDRYGKYTPFRKVSGGRLSLNSDMRNELSRLRRLRLVTQSSGQPP